jgi:flagellin-like protein
MKGISPMIATILLIAFTVAVGGIISIWLGGLSTTMTGRTEAAATNQTKCAGAWIKIDNVKTDRIFYSNPTIQNISSIKLYISDGTIITPTNTSLTPGDAASYNFIRDTNNSVTARGLCLASVPIEGKCSSGESCWE